jgi:hypothetical protein
MSESAEELERKNKWREKGKTVAQVVYLANQLQEIEEAISAQLALQRQLEETHEKACDTFAEWCERRYHVGGEVKCRHLAYHSQHVPYRVLSAPDNRPIFLCCACNSRIEFSDHQRAAAYCTQRSPYVVTSLANKDTLAQFGQVWTHFDYLDLQAQGSIYGAQCALDNLSTDQDSKEDQLAVLTGKPASDTNLQSAIIQLAQVSARQRYGRKDSSGPSGSSCSGSF